MKKGHLTLKVFALIILNDLLDSLAQLAMKKGLADTGITSITFHNVFEFGLQSLSSWFVWAGILIYVISFILWLVIIYRIDLSIAMPVGSAAYVFIPIMAIMFLHEHVSPIRWLGIALVILGIHFTAQSKKDPILK
ncbi:MAG: EamA family transporter [Candidatus Omnitrophota bacterium]